MRRSSRLQTRAMYARTPDNSLRVNAPDGFLHDFVPVGWGTSVDQIGPGDWWVGSDVGSPIGPGGSAGWQSRPTTGSPLTRPSNTSGSAVVAGSARILAAVTRCTSVIVNPVVRTPWQVLQAGVPVDGPRWLADPMGCDSLTGENAAVFAAGRRLTAQSFWSTVMVHALWFGFGPFMFQENRDGQPVPGSAHVLNPYMVGLSRDGRFELLADDDVVSTDHDGRFESGGVVWRIVAVRGLPPNNGHTPEGVLTRHFDLLRLGATIHTYSANTFGSGVPSGYLKVTTPNMTQEDADKLKSAWMAAHGGDKRSVAVLNAVTDYVPVSLTPVDADTGNLKASLLADIALAFSLDPIWVGQGASGLAYSNSSERRSDLVDLTVTAWGQQLMETITSVLPLGTVCRVDWPSFTAPELTVLGPVVQQLHASGLVTLDEARGFLGMAAAPPELEPVPDQAEEVTPDAAK